jgi:hypothetical protein
MKLEAVDCDAPTGVSVKTVVEPFTVALELSVEL